MEVRSDSSLDYPKEAPLEIKEDQLVFEREIQWISGIILRNASDNKIGVQVKQRQTQTESQTTSSLEVLPGVTVFFLTRMDASEIDQNMFPKAENRFSVIDSTSGAAFAGIGIMTIVQQC